MSKVVNNYVKVFYRIFPTENPCWDLLKVKDKSKVYLRNLQQLTDPTKSKQTPIFWEFETDGVFFNSRQELVYSEVIGDILDRVTKGNNGIIAAFGQTGSGKSLTVAGLQLTEENFGIVPRAINDLFALKKKLPRNLRMCIQMSYVEFSKTAVVDLLKDFPNNIDPWHTKETVTKMKVKSEFDALKLLYIGEGRKTSVQTGNYMSHYNTSVVTFHMTTIDLDFSNPCQVSSRMHVVDMAGVDIIGDESCMSCAYKDPLEVGYANLDKLNLGLFLTCLMAKNSELIRIKQRTNPLMYYLGNDLSNKSIARFIGHIKISRENLPITMSLLKFGQVLKGYKSTQKELDFDLDPEYQILYLQNQLDKMHVDKIANSVLLNQDLTSNLNADRMDHLQRTVNAYLKGTIHDINVMNVADTSVVFKLFKEMCNQLELERNKLAREKLQDSEMSLTKRAASKTSTSLSSLKERKGSNARKASKKLKESSSVIESVQTVEKVEKATSVPSLNDPKSKHYTGKTDRSSGSIPNMHKKKTSRTGKGSIGNIRRSTSISKRKSNASVSTTDNKFLVSDTILLPNDIPENREAWKLYITEASYKSLVEEYKANEGYIMATYSNYLGDIEKLQDIKNTVENMKHDITEANVMRKFNVCTKEGENKFAESILSEAELICKENLAHAQRDLLEQQETVLRSQAELKIYLNIRKDVKKRLNTDFENYCKDKFNVAVPNMKNLSEEEMVKDTKYSTATSEKNLDELRKMVTVSPQLSSLKKLMVKEHVKYDKLKRLSRITWTNLPTK